MDFMYLTPPLVAPGPMLLVAGTHSCSAQSFLGERPRAAIEQKSQTATKLDFFVWLGFAPPYSDLLGEATRLCPMVP